MGTISNLKDWLARKSAAKLAPVAVSPFGFTVEHSFVAWQSVSEVWGCTTDPHAADPVFLEFSAAGVTIKVCAEQPGFADLETAMIAIFPSTAAWRTAIPGPPFAEGRMLLYRRR